MRKSKSAALHALMVLNAGTVARAQPSVPANTILHVPGAQPDTRWHWIEVEADFNGWHITRGTATVQIKGGRFRADLQLDPNEPYGANLLLRGSIEHGRIHATEILLNTDASPVSVTGNILSQPSGDMLEQRVTFRGGQSGETSYLSMYRLAPRR